MNKKKMCCMFNVPDPKTAFETIDATEIKEIVSNKDNEFYDEDAGFRKILRCNKCGKYILLQYSESNYIPTQKEYLILPVEDITDAEVLNNNYNSWEIIYENDLIDRPILNVICNKFASTRWNYKWECAGEFVSGINLRRR